VSGRMGTLIKLAFLFGYLSHLKPSAVTAID
jgi:hypothetical protein